MRSRLRIEKDDTGFTMIELLVIMIIIAVLAGIAIPLLLNQREKGVQASVRSDLRNAATTMETYFVEKGLYPVDAADLEAPFAAEKNTAVSIVTTGNAPDTYCLQATNPGTDATLYYDSDKGGVQPIGTTCS